MKKKNVIMGLDMRNKYTYSTECEGVSLMNDDKMVKISEMPFGKSLRIIRKILFLYGMKRTKTVGKMN